jgi:thioesterase domain-containing protein
MTQVASATQIQRRVLLQPNGAGRPLFVFPGIHGTPETFRDLATRLGDDRPVFAFHLIGSLKESEPVRQVERLAKLYAAEVRSEQPHGPYYLFGYSFGGVLAFEVARELRSQSENVGLVIMADCPAPGYPKPAPVHVRIRTHAQNLMSRSNAERMRYLRERMDNGVARIGRVLGLMPSDAGDHTIDTTPPHIHRVNAALYEAYAHYRPSQQCVDVLFLTADTPPDWPGARFDDPLMGWSGLLAGRLSQWGIPGAHLSIFSPENVPVLAERLRSSLARAERAADLQKGAASQARQFNMVNQVNQVNLVNLVNPS